VARPIGYYFDVRLFEWAFSIPLGVIGIAMLIWPQISHGSILHLLLETIGDTTTALGFILTGIIGVVALIANGRSLCIGPRLRSLSAVVRSIIWLTFVLSMVRVSIAQDFPSPMIFFWSSFTGAEIFISFRAALDVRHNLVS
jgi:hypothetical protein